MQHCPHQKYFSIWYGKYARGGDGGGGTDDGGGRGGGLVLDDCDSTKSAKIVNKRPKLKSTNRDNGGSIITKAMQVQSLLGAKIKDFAAFLLFASSAFKVLRTLD